MTLPELLHTSLQWLGWSGLGMACLTLIAFLARWGFRYRLVGVTSFIIVLVLSVWSFGLSYKPTIHIEGARRLPIVFDNGNGLVIAQAPDDFPDEAIEPTLQELVLNLPSSGRSSSIVDVRIRSLVPIEEGLSQPVILGERTRDFREDIEILEKR